MFIIVYWSACIMRAIHEILNETEIFSTDFRKKLKYQISLIHPVGGKLFHAD